MKTGMYTAFADRQFIHGGRLNLFPINGARRGRVVDKQCRRCNYPNETLPHILNHCMRHSNTLQQRHNRIVKRLKTTAIFMNGGYMLRTKCCRKLTNLDDLTWC